MLTIIEKIYDNPILRRAIEEAFKQEEERVIAWTTVGLLKELYPDLSGRLNGDLISETEIGGKHGDK